MYGGTNLPCGRYDNIRMVTKLPPRRETQGRNLLAISSNDAASSRSKSKALAKSTDAKAYKVISHVWAPKDEPTLNAFYEAVTQSMLQAQKRRQSIKAESVAVLYCLKKLNCHTSFLPCPLRAGFVRGRW